MDPEYVYCHTSGSFLVDTSFTEGVFYKIIDSMYLFGSKRHVIEVNESEKKLILSAKLLESGEDRNFIIKEYAPAKKIKLKKVKCLG